MTRILIIGASRGIGYNTVQCALAQGLHVHAFARSATQISIEHPRLHKFDGDASDAKALHNALDKSDAVIQSIGLDHDVDRAEHPIYLFSRTTRVLIDLMEARGPKRLLCVTGYGAGESYKTLTTRQKRLFQKRFGRAYEDKDRQERLVEKSSLLWTIVRPGVLTNEPETDDYQVLCERTKWGNGSISRASVARFLVEHCQTETLVGQSPVLLQSRF